MKKLPRAIAWILGFSLLVWAIESHATEAQVSAAIIHVTRDGIPRFKIVRRANHPMAKEVSPSREKLAQAIVAAAQKHNIPEMLLVAIAFRENSFLPGGVGDIGEVSVFQIVPKNERFIRRGKFTWAKGYKEESCDLSTVEGSALCAAALLRIHVYKCRHLTLALMLYATGHTCKPYTKKLRWIQRDRFGIAEYLEDRFYD
jgi:hypothetical protein